MNVNNIKNLRKRMRLTQNELAAMCNVSQGALSGYETGRYEPDIGTIIKLSEIFGVPIDVVIGTDNPPPEQRPTVTAPPQQIYASHDLAIPKTSEARILSAGVDKMPAKDRERVLNMVRLMFDQYEEYFTERNDDDAPQL